MTTRLLVVCEAPADFRIATDLADRVLCDRIEWLDESLLPAQRSWAEIEPGRPFLRWQDLKHLKLPNGRPPRPRSRFGDEPTAPDAAAADIALQFAAFLPHSERPAAVLLIRDADNQPERRRGLQQASTRETGQDWPFRIIIGLADPKREAWVLAGFEPCDDAERACLQELRRELGLDPRTHSERLGARTPGSKHDAKRVVNKLTADNREREVKCWQEPPLEHLRTHGSANGLRSYLLDLDAQLVPLIGRDTTPPSPAHARPLSPPSR